MGRKLSFIHAADLHLGAPFRGLRALSDAWADRLLKAIPEAFDRVVDAAIARAVDFVVIAGDIFDTSRGSYADYVHFADACRRLQDAGIAVYFCTGNHDPYTSWQNRMVDLPDSAHMFTADEPAFFLHERDGEPLCLLGGRGYYNQTWSHTENISEGISREAAERALGTTAPFAVGVLHTGLHLDRLKAPCDPKLLYARGMDYWACGHVHQPWQDDAENPRIAFSGVIQGRDIKETGPRGVWHVVLEEGMPNKATFIPTASVVWERLFVDVSDAESLTAVEETIVRAQFRANGDAHCEEMVTRVTLTGTTPLHSLLQRPGVLDDVREGLNRRYPVFFCDALVDATAAPVDEKALRREGLFPATFLQAAEAQRRNPALGRALLQDEFLKLGMTLPARTERAVEELSNEAEHLVLDLLLGTGDAS